MVAEMTKKEALLHCFDLWLWLAFTGHKSKLKWPGWKRNGGWLEDCSADCPSCQYTISNDLSCSNCPIKWPGENCCDHGSPFTKWQVAESIEERTKYAGEIAVLALEGL